MTQDFSLIEAKLKTLNNDIESFTENLEFKIIKNFNWNELTEDLIGQEIDQLKHQGVYLLEINKGSESEIFDQWKKSFLNNWKNDTVTKCPKIASDRLKKHSDFNEWIPFYIGKSQNIQKRIKEHFYSLSPNSTTSALKLNQRKSLNKEIFRLSVIQIDTEHYDLVMHKIEHFLRNKYNPIVGKQ